MKKSLYDTPEMEIVALRKELSDLKSLHERESKSLAKDSISLSLKDLQHRKARIEGIRKRKQSLLKKIEKLQPTLFPYNRRGEIKK